MKLHKPLVEAVYKTLSEIFEDGIYADKAIEYTLKSNKLWGARDRAFIAETTYEIVRYYRLYTYCARTENNIWHIIASYLVCHNIELPNWPQFEKIRSSDILDRKSKSSKLLMICESIPDWLDRMGQEELGEKWPAVLHALNQKADFILRCNSLKMNVQDLINALLKENVQAEIIPNYPDAIKISRTNIFGSPLFKNGYFEVQDCSSQCVAEFMQLESGSRVIDACAGAGGKSLHIATLMKNKGYVLSLDTEDWKLAELKKRAKRNGIHIIETRKIENNKTIKRLEHSCDRLLLDVPCSGLGVLKRNPDSKWKLSEEFIQKVKLIQQDILNRYSKMLKPGGKMVYATCSILPSENQQQVNSFLEKNQEFVLEEEKILLPHENPGDGFYMARIVRQKK